MHQLRRAQSCSGQCQTRMGLTGVFWWGGAHGQTAIIWEADEPGEHVELTYEELLREVCKTANILKSYGVKKGDVSTLP